MPLLWLVTIDSSKIFIKEFNSVVCLPITSLSLVNIESCVWTNDCLNLVTLISMSWLISLSPSWNSFNSVFLKSVFALLWFSLKFSSSFNIKVLNSFDWLFRVLSKLERTNFSVCFKDSFNPAICMPNSWLITLTFSLFAHSACLISLSSWLIGTSILFIKFANRFFSVSSKLFIEASFNFASL